MGNRVLFSPCACFDTDLTLSGANNISAPQSESQMSEPRESLRFSIEVTENNLPQVLKAALSGIILMKLAVVTSDVVWNAETAQFGSKRTKTVQHRRRYHDPQPCHNSHSLALLSCTVPYGARFTSASIWKLKAQ